MSNSLKKLHRSSESFFVDLLSELDDVGSANNTIGGSAASIAVATSADDAATGNGTANSALPHTASCPVMPLVHDAPSAPGMTTAPSAPEMAMITAPKAPLEPLDETWLAFQRRAAEQQQRERGLARRMLAVSQPPSPPTEAISRLTLSAPSLAVVQDDGAEDIETRRERERKRRRQQAPAPLLSEQADLMQRVLEPGFFK